MVSHWHSLRVVAIAMMFTSPCVAEPIRVDINSDPLRRDVMTDGAMNWAVGTTPIVEASTLFGMTRVSLHAIGPTARFAGGWWKAGLDTRATLATDGAVVTGGGSLRLVIGGLTAGRHSIGTFHNVLSGNAGGHLLVRVNGGAPVRVRPSHRVTHDADAASAYLSVDVRDGEDVVVDVSPEAPGQDGVVVLNGFEVDRSDPARRALKPQPADGEEHAPPNTTLAWATRVERAKYRVFLSTSQDAVATATESLPEFRGVVVGHEYVPSSLRHVDTYYWRVDTMADDGTEPVRGEVWRFRTRHLAFPGAEGYGRFARGGRGGRVLAVTTLEDGGPGSLREAIEADGARTVVFRVGGTIGLKSKLVIRNPYVTIAGQTAPGDGIAVANYTFGCLGTHDVIMRHVRIRVGDAAGQTMDGTGFASTDHAIFDHCSISWGSDEVVSSRGAGNVTLQRCIVAQGLNVANHRKYGPGKGHSFAGSISGRVGSFHHNLVAHCAGRNWSLAGGLTPGGKFDGYLDIRNNVVYNWAHRTNDGGVRAANIVGNYYIPGPASRVFHLLKPDAGAHAIDDRQQYFMAGNVMEGYPQYDADNWRNGGAVVDDERQLDDVRLAKPFAESHVTDRTARQAYDTVMADVGANLPQLDAVDRVVVSDVRNRTFTYRGSKSGLPGIIDSPSDAGGLPMLRSGEAPPDRDGDGMPDAWELSHGLNPDDAEDGPRTATKPEGEVFYTNLELYLNELAAQPPRRVPDDGNRFHDAHGHD